jgi:amino acid transporter
MAATPPSHRLLKRGAMTALPLALTMFCQVSGGPFGLEELVKEVGSGVALLLIAVTPIVWAIPDALTTAELASAIPEEGGYIVWVRRAMGPFAAFVNAWWTWMYALVDAAIYPVLFATYLAGLLKSSIVANAIAGTPLQTLIESPLIRGHGSVWRWLVAFLVILVFSMLNVRGTKLVGRASSVFALMLIVPFAIMAAIGGWRLLQHPMPIVHEFVPKGESFLGTASAGLGIVLWNYLG